MKHLEALELLEKNAFHTGWVLQNGVLIFWEHDEDPPAPLTRPTDEILIADSADA